jgi:hypothetical protein
MMCSNNWYTAVYLLTRVCCVICTNIGKIADYLLLSVSCLTCSDTGQAAIFFLKFVFMCCVMFSDTGKQPCICWNCVCFVMRSEIGQSAVYVI